MTKWFLPSANAICYSVNEGDDLCDLSIAVGRCYCLFIADDFASSYGAPIRWRRVNFLVWPFARVGPDNGRRDAPSSEKKREKKKPRILSSSSYSSSSSSSPLISSSLMSSCILFFLNTVAMTSPRVETSTDAVRYNEVFIRRLFFFVSVLLLLLLL